MPLITDDATLTQVLNQCATTAIENVSVKILELLQKYILAETYGSHPDDPNRYYLAGTKTPSFEFLHAWEWSATMNTITSITKELWFNYLSMGYFGEVYKHGSPLEDRRSELAEDLNVMGIDLNNDWGGKERKPFWNDFLYELIEEDQIGKWFQDELFAMGFV